MNKGKMRRGQQAQWHLEEELVFSCLFFFFLLLSSVTYTKFLYVQKEIMCNFQWLLTANTLG